MDRKNLFIKRSLDNMPETKDEYLTGLTNGIKWGQENPTLQTAKDIIAAYLKCNGNSENKLDKEQLNSVLTTFYELREPLSLF